MCMFMLKQDWKSATDKPPAKAVLPGSVASPNIIQEELIDSVNVSVTSEQLLVPL